MLCGVDGSIIHRLLLNISLSIFLLFSLAVRTGIVVCFTVRFYVVYFFVVVMLFSNVSLSILPIGSLVFGTRIVVCFAVVLWAVKYSIIVLLVISVFDYPLARQLGGHFHQLHSSCRCSL